MADTAEVDTRGTGALRLPHLPALDGLRGIALVFVLLFHGGFGWVRAGYLPLSSFFVLSGFLITALLLLERQRSGSIDLRAFWARRARRLVPAMILGLGLVALYVAFGARDRIPHLEGDAIATITWVTNWRFIATDQTYADAFSSPSPLQHYWSLAVEEQFYLILPVLAAGLLAWRGKRALVTAVAALTVASVWTMRVLHEPGDEPLRAYLGTDTRAAELLIGVLLACALVGPQGLRRARGRWRPVLNAGSLVGLGAMVWCWMSVPAYSDAIFEGGLAALACVAALVVAAGTDRSMWVSRVLSLRGLTDLGRISYGVYLFHWPVFLYLDRSRLPLDRWAAFLVQMAVTVGLAALSFHLVERPIRIGRLPARIGALAWANASVAVISLVVIGLASVSAPTSGIPFQGRDTLAVAATDDLTTSEGSRALDVPATTTTAAPLAPTSTSTSAPPSTAPSASTPTSPPTSTAAGPSPVPAAPVTAAPPTTVPPAVKVLVVGDSVGDNLAWGLSQWGLQTGAVVVNNQSILGCMVSRGGLRRDPAGGGYPIPQRCEDYARTWPGYVAAVDPDVVVVVTGLNEIWDRKIEGWSSYKSPGDPDFDRWMLSEYAGAVGAARSRGAQVVWVAPPCVEYLHYGSTHVNSTHDPQGNARINHFRASILPRLAGEGAVVADLHRAVCPNGTLEDTVFGVPDARPDGVHFTGPASVEIARRFLGPIVLDAARP